MCGILTFQTLANQNVSILLQILQKEENANVYEACV